MYDRLNIFKKQFEIATMSDDSKKYHPKIIMVSVLNKYFIRSLLIVRRVRVRPSRYNTLLLLNTSDCQQFTNTIICVYVVYIVTRTILPTNTCAARHGKKYPLVSEYARTSYLTVYNAIRRLRVYKIYDISRNIFTTPRAWW